MKTRRAVLALFRHSIFVSLLVLFPVQANAENPAQPGAQDAQANAPDLPSAGCDNISKNKVGWHRCPWKEFFSIGPGISALSFDFETRRLGLFDTAAAVELHLSTWQFTTVSPGVRHADGTVTHEKHKLALWELGLGFQVQKRPAEEDLSFGMYVIPWGIRVDNFAVGIGISYTAMGSIDDGRWGLVLPLTYQLNL